MKKSFGERNFQLWHYRVSLGQLLIRSPKNDIKNVIKNIDIMFFAVEYIEIHPHLKNLEIEEATNKDVKYIKKKLGKTVETKKITILLSENKRYLVVAAGMKIVENELDLFETPFEKVGLMT